MKRIPAHARVVTFRSPPAEILVFSRSISDDDICAWCRQLFYSPGKMSVCRLHDDGNWPGQQNADGYFIQCNDFTEEEKL